MPEFSYRTVVPVRFRDIDVLGHVNNAVYATYLEQARRDYFADVLDCRLEMVDIVLAHLSVDFRTPIDGKNDVVIAMSVPTLGESSIPMEYQVRHGDAVAATAETVLVAIDGESESSRELPAEWRDRIEAYEGL